MGKLEYMNKRNFIGRDKSFDFIKGTLIFLVVWGHVIQYFGPEIFLIDPLYIWIYSFHMPLFIFISGYFAQHAVQQSFKKCLISKTKRLLVPALIWTIMRFCLNGIFLISEMGIFQAIYSSFRGCWFLYCLFIFYLLANILWKSKYKYLFAIALILIGYISYPYHPVDILKHFQLIRQWPLFVMGLFYGSSININKMCKRFLFYISLIIYSIWFYLLVIERRESLLFSGHTYLIRGIILIAGAIVFYKILGWLYAKFEKQFVVEKIVKLGGYTFGVYMLNVFVIWLVQYIFSFSRLNNLWMFVLAIIITLLCYYITNLIRKNNKLKKYLLGE